MCSFNYNNDITGVVVEIKIKLKREREIKSSGKNLQISHKAPPLPQLFSASLKTLFSHKFIIFKITPPCEMKSEDYLGKHLSISDFKRKHFISRGCFAKNYSQVY